MGSYLFYGRNIALERIRMEKQIATIFSLLSFNYLMFKYWGTEFIEDFNVIFIFGICVLGAYILWRKNKAGTLTEYEKEDGF